MCYLQRYSVHLTLNSINFTCSLFVSNYVHSNLGQLSKVGSALHDTKLCSDLNIFFWIKSDFVNIFLSRPSFTYDIYSFRYIVEMIMPKEKRRGQSPFLKFFHSSTKTYPPRVKSISSWHSFASLISFGTRM